MAKISAKVISREIMVDFADKPKWYYSMMSGMVFIIIMKLTTINVIIAVHSLNLWSPNNEVNSPVMMKHIEMRNSSGVLIHGLISGKYFECKMLDRGTYSIFFRFFSNFFSNVFSFQVELVESVEFGVSVELVESEKSVKFVEFAESIDSIDSNGIMR